MFVFFKVVLEIWFLYLGVNMCDIIIFYIFVIKVLCVLDFFMVILEVVCEFICCYLRIWEDMVW